jgi:hypothetical protein
VGVLLDGVVVVLDCVVVMALVVLVLVVSFVLLAGALPVVQALSASVAVAMAPATWRLDTFARYRVPWSVWRGFGSDGESRSWSGWVTGAATGS